MSAYGKDGNSFSTATMDLHGCDALFGLLLRYFEGKGHGWPFPKATMRPEDLPREAVRYLCVLDLVPGGEFRFRLFAAGLAAEYGHDLTGRLLREAETGESVPFLYDLYRSVADAARPLATRTAFRSPIGVIVYDRLILPLADAAGAVAALLVMIKPVEGLPRGMTVLEAMRGAGTELGRG